ncbi:palindromic element RPE4 domain-containing protein [Rickettsia japonica]|uniref:Palindromic element RPE4 domain-containing protein n=1 Tax=Rickettsia japonica TaxID=35790 RepID=A0ABM6YFJ1_RICJA|nr:palindromic element RPE4 domain-containing protein [Rickettsia japonica]
MSLKLFIYSSFVGLYFPNLISTNYSLRLLSSRGLTTGSSLFFYFELDLVVKPRGDICKLKVTKYGT